MKKSILAVIMTIMLFSANQLFAQTAPKIGYTNADAILSALPEAKTIEAELKAYQTQLSNQLNTMKKDFETKFAAYQKEAQNLAPTIREARERELQSLNQQMQEFEEKASADLQKKNLTLLEPVYDKIQKAIDEVAKAEGFTFILSSDASGFPIILYANEESNITNKVIVKLGGTVPAANTANKGTTTGKQ